LTPVLRANLRLVAALDGIQNALMPVSTNYRTASGGHVFNGSNVVNSGALKNTTWTVVINAPAGVYKYRCMLHAAMIGYLTVVENQSGESANAVSSRGVSERDDHFEEGETLLQLAITDNSQPVSAVFSPLPSPNTPTFQFTVGVGEGDVTLFEFIPKTATIPVGTTVRYINRDPWTPHTVTHGFDNLPGDPVGRTPVAGASNFTGQFFNSGFLFPAGSPPTADWIDVTFNAVGTFEIHCAIHGGMNSTVTVV